MGIGASVLSHPGDRQLVEVLLRGAQRLDTAFTEIPKSSVEDLSSDFKLIKGPAGRPVSSAFEVLQCTTFQGAALQSGSSQSRVVHFIESKIDRILNFRGNTPQLVNIASKQLKEIDREFSLSAVTATQTVTFGYYDHELEELKKRHIHCAISSNNELIIIHEPGDRLAEQLKHKLSSEKSFKTNSELIEDSFKSLFNMWREVIHDFIQVVPRSASNLVTLGRMTKHSYESETTSLATEIGTVLASIETGLTETASQIDSLLSDTTVKNSKLSQSAFGTLRDDAARFLAQCREVVREYRETLRDMVQSDAQHVDVSINHNQGYFNYGMAFSSLGVAVGGILIPSGYNIAGFSTIVIGSIAMASLIGYGKFKKWQMLK